MGVGHFDGVGDGAFGLLFEAFRTTVPELFAAEDSVVGSRRVAIAGLAVHADTKLRVFAVAEVGMVAACTTNRVVAREARVEEQLAAQFDLRAGERVLLKAYDLASTSFEPQRQLGLERDMIVGVGEPKLHLVECEVSLAAGNAIVEFFDAEQHGFRFGLSSLLLDLYRCGCRFLDLLSFLFREFLVGGFFSSRFAVIGGCVIVGSVIGVGVINV